MHRYSGVRHRAFTDPKAQPSPGQTISDTRGLAIRQYFQDCACPAARWANTFVQEADRYGLDWRLVASISMIESTGGKHYKNRNILGWKSALQRFRSEQAGIQYVSERLHHSPYYTGKSLVQMLQTYNSERRNYVALVTGVMQQLSAIEDRLRGLQASLADLPPYTRPKIGRVPGDLLPVHHSPFVVLGSVKSVVPSRS